MVKKSFYTAVCISFLLIAGGLLSGIDTGKNMPSLRIRSYFSKGLENSNSPLLCVTLFDVTSPDAVPMVRMLENLQDRFNFPFIGIAVNGKDVAQSFFTLHSPFSIALAQDENQRSRNTLAGKESFFPYCILAKDGVVQWTGHPTELENVIVHVLTGKFSLSRQRKVESLRRELQMAIQSGLPHVIDQSADKILAVSKGDRIAVQAKIMALNGSRRANEVLPFIRRVCRENPKDMQLRILEMDLLLRYGAGVGFVQAVERFVKDFASSGDKAFVSAAAYVIEKSPYGILSPVLMRTLAQKAFAVSSQSLKNGKKDVTYAIGCETLARVKAVFGDFKEAVRLQKEACSVRKGSRQEASSLTRLRYYEALLRQK